LVALMDTDDGSHLECHGILLTMEPPLIATWACLTEAMHIVGRRSGSHGRANLWKLVDSQTVVVCEHGPGELRRMRELMGKYHDLPMDLADASLVAIVESLNLTRIFTLDSDFEIYRLADGRAFEILP